MYLNGVIFPSVLLGLLALNEKRLLNKMIALSLSFRRWLSAMKCKCKVQTNKSQKKKIDLKLYNCSLFDSLALVHFGILSSLKAYLSQNTDIPVCLVNDVINDFNVLCVG